MDYKEEKKRGIIASFGAGRPAPTLDKAVQYTLDPTINNAYCPPVEKTQSETIDLSKLNPSGGGVFNTTLKNTTGVAAIIVIGSRAGIATLGKDIYGIDVNGLENGADLAGITADGFPAVKKLQELAALVSQHGALATNLEIFANSALQNRVKPLSLQLTYNGDSKITKMSNIISNSDLNVVSLTGCHFGLTSMNGIIYTLLAGEEVDLEFDFVGIAMGESVVAR